MGTFESYDLGPSNYDFFAAAGSCWSMTLTTLPGSDCLSNEIFRFNRIAFVVEFDRPGDSFEAFQVARGGGYVRARRFLSRVHLQPSFHRLIIRAGEGSGINPRLQRLLRNRG